MFTNHSRRQELRERLRSVFNMDLEESTDMKPKTSVLLFSGLAVLGILLGGVIIYLVSINKVVPHFSFDYADDIKSDLLFDTQAERDAYKKQALSDMEKLFKDFHKRFGFQPEHEIHVTLSERVQGGKNSAYTTKTYTADGRIVKLSMHFPYEMFDKKFVRAHELTHAFVAPFYLPTWADEGFAVLVENFYSDSPTHPVYKSRTEIILKDKHGINAIQNWREGQGIYADAELTQWCYRYSHTIVRHIETKWPGTFASVFEQVHPHTTLSNKAFISVLDNIITGTDMVDFFKQIGFKL